MAQQDANQPQKMVNAGAVGSSLQELVRLLARLAARDAFECTAAAHLRASGCNQLEPEDINEAKA